MNLQRILAQATAPTRIHNPSNAYVKNVRQDLIKDTGLSKGARLSLILLAGWDGYGLGVINTFVESIAKAMGVSVRQMHRYLNELRDFGYIHTRKNKDRLGYITGLRINLVRCLINPKPVYKVAPESHGFRAMTKTADINKNNIIKKDITGAKIGYDEFMQRTSAMLEPSG